MGALLREEKQVRLKESFQACGKESRSIFRIPDSYESLNAGYEMTLVAGNKDYIPAIEKLVGRKIPILVIFWGHAARELRESCTKFVSLNPYLDLIRM